MPRYRIWAVDCDGPGDVRYAPTFDNEADAQAWIDDFDNSDGEISRMWIEEEESVYHEVYGEYEGGTE
ncbi:hypothetical protein UFOVP46_91 [uncultured Caudovirales phage]|uniref:Uncharacterized protein n=1 Tax=uncultured Caudovirales phage TaxID=2100421 RepID=A0A6J5KR80_9CAUD|nr:hypothetical protein UFOVP46_91 [uncultured Caudovirales phage]